MKFLCDACERLVTLETFRTEAGGLVVTCGRCGAEGRVGPSVAGASPRAERTSESVGTPPRDEGPGSQRPSVPAPGGLGTSPSSAATSERFDSSRPADFASGTRGGAWSADAAHGGSPGSQRSASDVSSTPHASAPGAFAAPSSPFGAASTAPRAGAPSLRVVRGEAGQPLPLTDEVLFEPPEGACPKCVAPRREEALACPQCGLVYVNHVPESHAPSDILADAWRTLATRWEDWDAHDRLMTLAVGRGELAMVGRLYRIRLARAPGDTAAQRGRDEVVRRATLVVPSSSDLGGSSQVLDRVKKVAIGVGFVVVLVLAMLVFQHLRTMMAGD